MAVVGRIQTRTWNDDNGVKHYATEVVAEEAYFADSKRNKESSNSGFETTEQTEFSVVNDDDLPF